MKHVELSCGFEADVDERIADDFEVLWMLRKVDTNINYIFELMIKIFGDDEKIDKLVEALKDEDGFVSNEKIGDAIMEVFDQLGDEGKNS